MLYYIWKNYPFTINNLSKWKVYKGCIMNTGESHVSQWYWYKGRRLQSTGWRDEQPFHRPWCPFVVSRAKRAFLSPNLSLFDVLITGLFQWTRNGRDFCFLSQNINRCQLLIPLCTGVSLTPWVISKGHFFGNASISSSGMSAHFLINNVNIKVCPTTLEFLLIPKAINKILWWYLGAFSKINHNL